MTMTTVADSLTDVRRQAREKQQTKYAALIRKTATASSLTDAEFADLDELLAPLALTPEDVRLHTETVQRHGQLVKDVAAGGLAEAEVKEEREKVAADFKPYSNFQRRTELLAQLEAEADALRLRLKTANGRLSDLATQRQELADLEAESGWLVIPPAPKKATPRKGR